ncbi:dihydrofolate reductase family protein [Streptomyces sp. S1D4-23]|nr:dihydrofolate reductase family protein [Streptomyces sp. S1D4-23]
MRSLLEQDLLDELVLLIHPVVAGEGRKKLFADDATLKKLQLVSARPTSSGVIIATYRPTR